MRDMNEVLERWGVWARDNSGIDYSPIAAGFKGLLSYKSNGELSCCDDDGLVIDGCVGRLKKYKPEEFDLIIAHHVYGISLRKIALKGNVQTVRYVKRCKRRRDLSVDAWRCWI